MKKTDTEIPAPQEQAAEVQPTNVVEFGKMLPPSVVEQVIKSNSAYIIASTLGKQLMDHQRRGQEIMKAASESSTHLMTENNKLRDMLAELEQKKDG